MTVSVKYFISDSNGSFINWGEDASGFSVLGKEVDISGGAGPDTVFVQAGASASLVELGDNDTVYLTGNLEDYSQLIDQDTGVYTFTRTTGLSAGQSEVVKVTVSNQNLVLSFADGKVNLNAESNTRLYENDQYQAIANDSLAPGGTPAGGIAGIVSGGTSPVSQVPIKVFISDSAGVDLPGLARAGQSMIVSGASGVDRVYVMAGTSVDASALGLGNDKVYLTGKLSDYTQSIDPDTGIYSFTRTAGLPAGQVEVIKVTVSNEDDVLVFADGSICLNAETDSRLYDAASGFQIIQSGWLDSKETTPGVRLTVGALRLSADTGSSATDFVTSQADQTISGTLSAALKPGMHLFGSVDGGMTWVDITDKVSATSIHWDNVKLTGSNKIAFKTVDSSGVETAISGSHSYQLDTSAPIAPVLTLANDTGISAGDGVTLDNTVNVQKIEEGSSWEYRIDGGAWQQGSGTSFLASPGTHAYEVRQSDLAGNLSTVNANKIISVESSTVAQVGSISKVTDNFSSNNSVGSIAEPVNVAKGSSSDDMTPSLSGRLDAPLVSGQFLSVYDSVGGMKTKIGVATVNPDLSWTFTPETALSSGYHHFSVRVESTAGAEGVSSDAYEVILHNSLSMNMSDDIGTAQGVLTNNGSVALNALAINAPAKTLLVRGVGGDVDIAALQCTVQWPGGDGAATLIPGSIDSSVDGKVTFWVGNFDGITTRAIQMQLEDLPGGGVSLQVLQGKSHQANVLDGSFSFDDGGQVESGYTMRQVAYLIPPVTDDVRLTFSGVLSGALGSGEEIVVYQTQHGVRTKLGVAIVNGLDWSFTPATDLADGNYTFQAMIQPVGDSSGTVGHVISAPKRVVIQSSAPSQVAVITSATDNIGSNGSVGSPALPATIGNGSSTDDATPTLSGTLDAALNSGQLLAVYDNINGVRSKIGVATVNADLTWTFTPSGNLSNGHHSFSVQVESPSGAKGPTSASYEVGVHSTLSMNISDNAGAVQGPLIGNDSTTISELAINAGAKKLLGQGKSADVDIAAFQSTLQWASGSSGVGLLIPGLVDRSVMGKVTFWVGSYDGAVTRAIQMQLQDLPDGSVTLQALQGKSHQANALDGSFNFDTDGQPDSSFVVFNIVYPLPLVTDDTRPMFSGVLNTSVSAGEEVAIYSMHHGVKAKLGVATVKGLEWSFMPAVPLADGTYTFQALVQPVGDTAGNFGKVASAAKRVTVDSSAPSQMALITAATDNFSSNGSSGSSASPATIANGDSTDDTTPTLIGTVDSALKHGQFLAIYDSVNGVKTKVGTATVSPDLTWTFTPANSLSKGPHSFTVQVESTSGGKGRSSASYDIGVYNNLSMSVLDDVGAGQGVLNNTRTSILNAFNVGGTPQSLPMYSNSADVDITAFHWVVGFNGISEEGTVIPGLEDRSVAGQVTFWVGVFKDGYTVAVQMQLKNALDGQVTLQELQSKWVTGNAFAESINFNTSGNLQNTFTVPTVRFPTPATTDDARPTLAGTLSAVLNTTEEVAIYRLRDGVRTKLGIASVNGLRWSFTPDTDLTDGNYTFQVMVQPLGDTSGVLGHLVTIPQPILIDATTVLRTASITSLQDNVSINGSVGNSVSPIAVVSGDSSDDARPTLSGSLSSNLASGQYVAVYDTINNVRSKIGTATVSDLHWTFTPLVNLSSGHHSFSVQIESIAGVRGVPSAAYNFELHDVLPFTILDDFGGVRGVLTSPSNATLTQFAVGGTPQSLPGYDNVYGVDNILDFSWTLHWNGNLTGVGAVVPGSIDHSVAGQLTFWVGVVHGNYTVAVQMCLKDVPGGGVTLQELQSKWTSGNAFATSFDFNAGGNLNNSYTVSSVAFPNPIVTDDARPTFTGTLRATVGAGEELAIYRIQDGTRIKLGTALINGLDWAFTPDTALADGAYTLQAMIQPIGDTSGSVGHVVSGHRALVIDTSEPRPTQTAVITSARDNVSVNGSTGSATAPVAVSSGSGTDDKTPSLEGTLDAPLGSGQSLCVYDNTNGANLKIGIATVNADLTWSYTPHDSLTSGQHSFTVVVESTGGAQGPMSPGFDVVVYDDFKMSLTDDVGTLQETFVPTTFRLGELSAYSGPQNILTKNDIERIDIADFQWVLKWNGTLTGAGALIPGLVDRSVPGQLTFWVGTFRDTYTVAVQMRLKNLPDGGVSLQELQSKWADGDAFSTPINFNTSGNLQNTYSVSTVIYNERHVIDDGMPTFTGKLNAHMSAGEEVAVYQTLNGLTTKLGVAVVNGLDWSFTPATHLANGLYQFQALLQPIGDSTGKIGQVVSAPIPVLVDSVAPVQTATITIVADNLSVNGSVGSNASPATIVNGGSTDDATPTLTGILDAALNVGQYLSVYDTYNGVKTKIGTASVNSDLTWAFTPLSKLSGGVHTFTVQVESVSGFKAPASLPYDVSIHGPMSLVLMDHVGAVQGALAPTTITLGRFDITSAPQHLRTNCSTAEVDVERFSWVLGFNGFTAVGRIVPGLVDRSVAGQITFWVEAPAGSYNAAIQLLLKDQQGGGLTLTQLQSKYSTGTPGTTDYNTSGHAISGYTVTRTDYLEPAATDDARPTFEGKISALLGTGEEVAVYQTYKGVKTKLGVANVNDLNWTFSPFADLPDGFYKFEAVVQSVGDSTGVGGKVVSAPMTFLVDRGVPTQTAVIAAMMDDYDANGSVGSSGASNTLPTGSSTDDATPTLKGALDAALRLGQVLSVYDTVGGVRAKIGVATVNSDLTWTFTPGRSLATGAHSFTVQVESAAGAPGPSSASYDISLYDFLPMTVSDDVGSKQGALSKDTLAIGTLALDSTVKPILSRGHASEVDLSAFNWSVLIGDVQRPAIVVPGSIDRSVDGQVTFWVAGQYNARSRAVQIQLKDLSVGGVSIQAIQGKKVNADATLGYVDLNVSGEYDGAAAVLNVSYRPLPSTDDVRPTLTGELFAPLGSDEVVAIYQTYEGVRTKVGTASIDGLKWTFTQDNDLVDGKYAFQAVLESKDIAVGNQPRVVSRMETFYIDTNAPVALAYIAAVEDNAGINGSEGSTALSAMVKQGFSTDDVTPSLKGTLDTILAATESLVVYDNFNGMLTKIGTATVDGFNWNFVPGSNLSSGKHSFIVRVESVSGNSGDFSNSYELNVHNELPMSITEHLGNSQLLLSSGAVTLDNRPTFSGRLGAALGKDEEIAIYQSLNGVTSMVGVANIVDQTWSFTPSNELANGVYNFKAVLQTVGNVTDARGHVISMSQPLVIDRALPHQLAQIIVVSADSEDDALTVNSISSGDATDDLTPTFSGKLSDQLHFGQTLAIYDVYNGVRTKLGLASVSGTNWNYTPHSELGVGQHHFSVQVESAAGNKGATSEAFDLALYKSLSFKVTDDVGTEQGVLGNGSGTDDGLLTFTGTLLSPLGSGEEVAVYQTLNGIKTKTGTATVNADLSWVFTPTAQFAGGTYIFEAFIQPSGEQTGSGAHVKSSQVTLTVVANQSSPVLRSPTFTVTESGRETDSLVITAQDLGLPAEHSLSTLINFQVTEAMGGEFIMNGVSVNQFSLSDVSAGLVNFVHRFNSGQPAFVLSVGESDRLLGIVKSSIDFHPVGHLIFGDGSGGGGGGSLEGGYGGKGGSGDDNIVGTALADVIFGDGSGGGEGQHTVTVGGHPHGGAAGNGNDTIYGGFGDDIIFADGFAGGEIRQYADAYRGGAGGYGGGGSGSGNQFQSIGGGGQGEDSTVGRTSPAGHYAWSNGASRPGGGGGVSANGSSSESADGNEQSVEVGLSDSVYKRVIDDWSNPNSQIYMQKMGDGRDFIDGGAGNDRIHAGGGDDVIIGGLGADDVWGGAGADKFIFRFADFDGSTDLIRDFNYVEGDQIFIQAGGGTRLDFSYNESLHEVTIKVDPSGSGDFSKPVETIILSNMDSSMMTGLMSSTVLG